MGGAAYSKGEQINLKAIRDISLMPAFCHTRIYPRELEGRWIHSCMYVKMPLFLISSEKSACGVAFPVNVTVEGVKIPLTFSLSSVENRTVFELGITGDEQVFKRKKKEYDDWLSPHVELEKKQVTRDLRDRRISLSFDFYEGRGWKDVVRDFLKGRPKARVGEIDLNVHLSKSVNWLNSVFDPEYNLFLFGTRRERLAPAGNYWGLPTYNTLASDLYSLSKRVKHESILEMSRAAKELMLHENASKLLENGRVWHNAARFDVRSRKLTFYSHLGTGIAGYPGGQATALRALLERVCLGDDDSRLIRAIKEGLSWLESSMFEDGHWARTYPVFEEASKFKMERGEESYSVGGNGEGVTALLLAYRLFQDDSYLASAIKALEWTNRFAEGGVLTSGYLRDNRQEEVDGVSAIFAAQANLLACEITGEGLYRQMAEEFATYLLTWQRWWDVPAFDTLIFSFSPRIATCETVWLADVYYEMYRHTEDEFWLRQSETAFGALGSEDAYRGYGEGFYYDEELRLHPLMFDAVYSASAVLRYALHRLERDELNINVESERLHRIFKRKMRRGKIERGLAKIRRVIR